MTTNNTVLKPTTKQNIPVVTSGGKSTATSNTSS